MKGLVLCYEAWVSIQAHKLRSFLTMLGIIIGVAAISLTIIAGHTLKQIAERRFSSISNVIVITPTKQQFKKFGTDTGRDSDLSGKDIESIKAVRDIRYVAPVIQQLGRVQYRNKNRNVLLIGSTADYLKARNLPVVKGVSFAEKDNRTAREVVIIGNTIKEKLFFKNENPIGKEIKIHKMPFTIIGVAQKMGRSLGGKDRDNIIIVPERVARKFLIKRKDKNAIDYLIASIGNSKNIPKIKQDITELLRYNHGLRAFETNDFRVSNRIELVKTFRMIGNAIALTLSIIAAISLIVGSIGISNMMLMSVAERRSEIGMRKAIGAKDRTIMIQFLLETVFLTLIGALIGILCTMGVCFATMAVFHLEIVMHYSALIIPFLVALLVGVLAGIIPAVKSVQLSPIEALH
jgi:putative ABC transport system permease protein